MASGLENIETIESPFRRFVTTIGVFPTAFTDAMTYYECLAYLVKYLEDSVVPAVNENAEALQELQDYVVHYFDNLDVQEEINNKLDQMAQDGTLGEIVGAYCDPKIEQVSSELDNEITARQTADQSLQTQINSLASGSPIAVSSTSDMTDTSKVYVNTTNGKWYYYDGDSWEIGGTYQSTAVAEDSVDLTMLDGSVFKNATKSTSTFAKGGINNGVVISADNRVYTTISSIVTCDTIYIKINDATLTPTVFCRFNGDNWSSNFTTSSSKWVTSLGNGAYMITRGNFNTLKIVWKKANDANFTDDEVSALSLAVYQTTQYQEKDLCLSEIDTIPFEMGATNYVNGALVSNTIRARSLPIDISKNVGYRYFKIDGATNDMKLSNVVLYLDGAYVAGYNDEGIKALNTMWASIGHLKVYCDGSFNQIRICFSKLNNAEFTNDEISSLNVKCNIKDSEKTKWNGKKYVALGDSITYGFIPRNYTGYPGQLNSYAKLTAESLGMSFVNAGVNGNTIALAIDGGTPMCERYTELDNDADLITVMGGTNDIRKGVTLGQMSDRTENTFYGALHILLGGLYKKYFIDQGTTTGKNKHIVVITPPKLLQTSGGTSGGTGTLYDLEPWCNAMKEVASYYSIPVLDMYNLSNINPHLNQTVHGTEAGYTDYYNPYITDGTHPTQEGADIMAKVLEGYLNTII